MPVDDLEQGAIGDGNLEFVASAVSPRGDYAIVLLRSPSGWLIERLCERDEDGWEISEFDPSSSGGGASYHGMPSGREGVVTISDEVPEMVRAVVVRLGAREQEVPARNGHFIAAWWGISERDALRPEPQVIGYVLEDGTTTEPRRA